jgi:hypothetical protein
LVKLALPRKGDCAPLAIIELIKGVHLSAFTSSDKTKTEAENASAGAQTKNSARKAKTQKVAVTKSTAKKDSSSGGTKPKTTHRKIGS